MKITTKQLRQLGITVDGSGHARRAPIKPKRERRRRASRPVEYIDFAVRRTDCGVEISMPIRLISEANQREHHMAKHRRKLGQQAKFAMLIHMAAPFPPPPLMITMTRHGPKLLDPDNKAGSFKHVQDAMARTLGIDDGDIARVSWDYKQQAGKRYGVTFLIESRTT